MCEPPQWGLFAGRGRIFTKFACGASTRDYKRNRPHREWIATLALLNTPNWQSAQSENESPSVGERLGRPIPYLNFQRKRGINRRQRVQFIEGARWPRGCTT